MRFIGNKPRSGSLSGSGTIKSGSLRGIDSTSAQDERTISRADGVSFYDGSARPGTVNMIRTELGRVGKRPGYKIYPKPQGLGNIGGVFRFFIDDKELSFYISGSSMTVCGDEDTQSKTITLPDNFNDCTAILSEDCVFFMNGKFLFIYRASDNTSYYIGTDGSSSVNDNVNPFAGLYLPTMFIGCTPGGSGSTYEALNLLNPYVSEQFIADGTSNVYTVHMDIKPNTAVHAFTKNSSGDWESIAVLSVSGRNVKFTIPPAASQVAGEDNLKIIYIYNSFSDNAYKLAGCRCMAMFGVSGYKDRVFLSGNSACPSMVYYSEMEKFLYFPDLNYIRAGQTGTKVAALAGDDTRLAVICNDGIYMVSGSAAAGGDGFLQSARFLISGILRTPMPVENVGVEIFDNEAVYLTKSGVTAITASGVLDERCCQIRSAMINYHLLSEDLSACRMLSYGDFLVISNGIDTLYFLDSKQYSKSGEEPFSYRQYDGYIWENVPAKYIWMQDGALFFSDGKNIFGFNESFKSNSDYRDENVSESGETVYSNIDAYWETPDIYCNSFHVNKFFTRMGALLSGSIAEDGAPVNTDVKISARFDNDDWRVIKDYGGELSVFRYSNISYARFTYSDRPGSYALYIRLLHKRGKSVRLRFENDNVDQPFTLCGFLIEYSIM